MQPIKTSLLKHLFFFLGESLRRSYRFRYFGLQNLNQARSQHKEGVYCIASWHEHSLAGVLSQKGLPYCFLISPSRDGEMVSFLSKKLGYQTVRGSSSRGGKEASSELIRKALDEKMPIAITVDGPRGPRRKCKAGIVKVALSCQGTVVPICAVSQSPWVLKKTWDQTKIPKPFSKIVCQFGEGIRIPESLTSDEFNKRLELIEKGLLKAELEAYQNIARWHKGRKISELTETFF